MFLLSLFPAAVEWAFSCSREALLLCEGWSGGRSLLSWRRFEGASAAMNWQLRCTVWLFGLSFGAAPAPACYPSVFTSPLAREGRKGETLSSGSSLNPREDVKYIVVRTTLCSAVIFVEL